MCFFRTIYSAAPRSGPSPMSTSLAGIFSRTSAKISTTSVRRFTGREFERGLRIGSRAGGRPARARRFICRLLVKITVHEIRNHLNGPLDFEFLQGAVAQVIRNSGHAVALLDGKSRDGQIAAVAADQRDIGAMERGDERQAPGRSHHTG